MLQPNPLRSLSRTPEAGLALIEVAAALAIFAVLILSVLVTLTQGIVHRRETFESYLAMQSLRDQIANAQGTANQPQNLTLQAGIGAVYTKFSGVSTTVT